MDEVQRLIDAYYAVNEDASIEYEKNIKYAKRLVEYKRKMAQDFLAEAQEKCSHPNTEKSVDKYIPSSVLFGDGDVTASDSIHLYKIICLKCGKYWTTQ